MSLNEPPGYLVISSRIRVPYAEFEFTYARSSGAGGQNVNKVNSKAILRWRPGESRSLPADVRERFLAAYRTRLTTTGDLVLSSEAHRDQIRNAADCVDKLRAMLEQTARAPKARKKTKPSYGSKQRRLASKKADSDKKRGRSGHGWE